MIAELTATARLIEQQSVAQRKVKLRCEKVGAQWMACICKYASDVVLSCTTNTGKDLLLVRIAPTMQDALRQLDVLCGEAAP